MRLLTRFDLVERHTRHLSPLCQPNAYILALDDDWRTLAQASAHCSSSVPTVPPRGYCGAPVLSSPVLKPTPTISLINSLTCSWSAGSRSAKYSGVARVRPSTDDQVQFQTFLSDQLHDER